jgi:hypothetical protein
MQWWKEERTRPAERLLVLRGSAQRGTGVAVTCALPGCCCTLTSAEAIGASAMAAAEAAIGQGCKMAKFHCSSLSFGSSADSIRLVDARAIVVAATTQTDCGKR